MSKETTKKETTAVTVPHARSVLSNMAARYNVDGSKLTETLKQTVFKGATNEQLMALCIVADQYKLNPFTKEIYAFPDSKTGGIVPVVGIDGWLRIINEHPEYDGMEVECGTDACTVTIYRKDRAHATVMTEYLAEVKRNTAPWTSHPMRMLRHKAIIQCARAAFGYTGIKDPDEAERIIEAERAPVAMPRVITVESETAKADATPPTPETAPDLPY